MSVWYKTILRTLSLITGWLVAAGTAQAVIIGLPAEPQGGNCLPFGCSLGITHFQEVYASSAFSGPLTIGEIDFFKTNSTPPGNLNNGTFTLSLSTTSKPVGGLDTSNLANNLGVDNTLFTVAVLSGGPADSILSFWGGPFVYNPAAGNLLLDIQMSGVFQAGNGAYLDVPARPSGNLGRAFSGPSFGAGQDSDGLVTRFLFVPEPATLGLLGLGLAGLVFLRGRKPN